MKTLPDNLFEEAARKARLLNDEQLARCREVQKRLAELGIQKSLAQVSEELEFLSWRQIRQLLRRASAEHLSVEIEGYEIEGLIGRGAICDVYRATQKSPRRTVALKVLSLPSTLKEECVERFDSEARAIASLRHPNIVTAFDVGESNGWHYIAMEFVDGLTLRDMVKRMGPLPERNILSVGQQIADALQYVHDQGIIHRDVKPSNIMLSSDGTSKLCDLGMAQVRRADDPTAPGTTVGTPEFIAPEQARGVHDLDGRADVYSLGATLFFAAAGRPPHQGTTRDEILEKHVKHPAPWLSDVQPSISEELSRVIAHALERDRDRRYATAADFAADLRRVQHKQEPAAPPRRRPTELKKPSETPEPQKTETFVFSLRSKQAVSLVLAVLVIGFCVGIAVTRIASRGLPSPQPVIEMADRLVAENPPNYRAAIAALKAAEQIVFDNRIQWELHKKRKSIEERYERSANAVAAKAIESAKTLAKEKQFGPAKTALMKALPLIRETKAEELVRAALADIERQAEHELQLRKELAKKAITKGDWGRAKRILYALDIDGLHTQVRERDEFWKQLQPAGVAKTSGTTQTLKAENLWGALRARNFEIVLHAYPALQEAAPGKTIPLRAKLAVQLAQLAQTGWLEAAKELAPRGKEIHAQDVATGKPLILIPRDANLPRFVTKSGKVVSPSDISADDFLRICRLAMSVCVKDLCRQKIQGAIAAVLYVHGKRHEAKKLLYGVFDPLARQTLKTIEKTEDQEMYQLLAKARAAKDQRKWEDALRAVEQLEKDCAEALKRCGEENTVQQIKQIILAQRNTPPGMVYVPSGDCWIGSEDFSNERPLHLVSFQPFYIDKTEVTNGDYEAFVKTGSVPPPPHWGGKQCPPDLVDLPVTNITWAEAAAYAKWKGKRLPTEEEWEYAARGTDSLTWPWGDTPWKESYGIVALSLEELTKVNAFPDSKSPFGCFGMASNAWEWTSSNYAPYPGSNAVDPKFNKGYKVVRGGSWRTGGMSPAKDMGNRCSARFAFPPYERRNYIGFRCVKPVSIQPSKIEKIDKNK